MALKRDDETEQAECAHERRALHHTNSSGGGWSWCLDCGAKLFPPLEREPSKHWPRQADRGD